MKTIKVIAICVTLVTLPVLIESCCLGNGSCGCGGNDNWETNFSITAIDLTVEKAASVSTSAVNPSPGPLATHVFVLYLDGKYRTSQLDASYKPTMAAYACSPPPAICDQKITSIIVTSNNTLTTINKSFAAGEDLKEIFVHSEFGALANIINAEIMDNRIAFLARQQQVDVTQTHRLNVFLKLDDNRTFDLQTDDLEFTPN